MHNKKKRQWQKSKVKNSKKKLYSKMTKEKYFVFLNVFFMVYYNTY